MTEHNGPDRVVPADAELEKRKDEARLAVIRALNGTSDGRKNRRAIVAAVASELYPIVRSGKTIKVPLWEIALMKLNQLARGGKRRSQKKQRKLQKQLIPQAARRGGILWAPEPLSVEEFIRRHSFPEDLAKLTDEQIKNLK
jgi:hypothetical protein